MTKKRKQQREAEREEQDDAPPQPKELGEEQLDDVAGGARGPRTDGDIPIHT